MNIFGGPGKKRSRGQRGRDAKRGRSAPRHRRPTPLDGLVDEQRVVASSGARKEGKGDAVVAGITMGHIAFLLAGLTLGAGMLLGFNFLASLKHAREEEATAQAAAEKPPAARPPAPRPRQLTQATTPVEAVRLMLKASVSGDRETAYAQWEIAPDETATIKSGQAVSLAELTAVTYAYRNRLRLEEYDYAVKSQSGDEVKVVQTRDQVVTQVFSLHRRGPYWKLRYASPP